MSDGTAGERPMIECSDLLKVYPVDGADVIALQGLELRVRAGERVGVVGASGSGKTTLLNILGGLDRPTAGVAAVAGIDLGTLPAGRRSAYRQATIGFVWQQSSRNLLPQLSARDNVALPSRRRRRAARRRADELLDLVGLAHRADHRPVELSGGEQQRVAIAVALVNEPPLLLADEPTGELDTTTSARINELLADVSARTGMTQLIVSHDPSLAEHVDRVVDVRDGRIAAERDASHRTDDGDYEEFLTVDRFGRIQLAPEQRQLLASSDRVRVTLDGTTIRLDPARPLHGDGNRRGADEAADPGAVGADDGDDGPAGGAT